MERKERAGETLSLWTIASSTYQTIADSLTSYWRMIGNERTANVQGNTVLGNDDLLCRDCDHVHSEEPSMTYFKDLPVAHKVFVLGSLWVMYLIMVELL